MRATEEFVRERFRQFNQVIFDGKLPPLTIRIGMAKTMLGSVSCKIMRHPFGQSAARDFKMTISALRDLPERELEDVILHEMIHYYIMCNGLKDTSPHGKLFRQMMAAINKGYGRKISISHKSVKGESTVDQRIRNHYFCLAEFNDGRIGICMVARSRMFEMWKSIPLLFDLKNIGWYWSCEQCLNKYPTCRKPKFYILPDGESDAILRNSKRLANYGRIIKPVD